MTQQPVLIYVDELGHVLAEEIVCVGSKITLVSYDLCCDRSMAMVLADVGALS